MQADRTSAFSAPDRAILDVCGRRRSPATFPEFHQGRKPGNAGQRYPTEAPTIAQVVAVMNACDDTITGQRNRALMLVMWRTGLRISEALGLYEQDLNEHAGTVFVRSGKGSKSRLIGMDQHTGFANLKPWLDVRRELPNGPLFPVVLGTTAGRRWSASGARGCIHRMAERSGIRFYFHPHSLRHACAVEMWREGVDILIIRDQLGHTNIATTMVYLRALCNKEVIDAVSRRQLPMVPAM
jgi:site-specific recombinase XerD